MKQTNSLRRSNGRPIGHAPRAHAGAACLLLALTASHSAGAKAAAKPLFGLELEVSTAHQIVQALGHPQLVYLAGEDTGPTSPSDPLLYSHVRPFDSVAASPAEVVFAIDSTTQRLSGVVVSFSSEGKPSPVSVADLHRGFGSPGRTVHLLWDLDGVHECDDPDGNKTVLLYPGLQMVAFVDMWDPSRITMLEFSGEASRKAYPPCPKVKSKP